MINPKVSIIIVNWNAKQYLENCINSIKDQSYMNYEVILVDNNSSDDSVEFVRKNFPQVMVIKNDSNLGFAQGNNIGIKESEGDIIALLNPDTIADVPEELAKKVIQVYNNKEIWNKLSENGLLHAENHYAPEIIRSAIKNLFQTVLN